MWVDTHCHLDDERIVIEDALASAKEAQVTKMVSIGCAKSEWAPVSELAAANESVSCALGVHPHEASSGTEGLREALGAPGVVAVGECGLDYHYNLSDRDSQREAFKTQIELANELGLPLVIHTRSAWDETFELLDAVGTPEKTVFHCFSGGVAEAEKCLERNCYLSFSGIVTFPSAKDNIAKAAAIVPDDRFVIETDAPYLAPVPLRGTDNIPANVAVTGAFIADLRSQRPQEVAAITTANAELIFGI